MRFVIYTPEDSAVDLNHMWLPTWLGMNPVFKKEVEAHVGPLLVGEKPTEEVLDKAHEEVIQFILKKFPGMPGLEGYLRAVEHVKDGADQDR